MCSDLRCGGVVRPLSELLLPELLLPGEESRLLRQSLRDRLARCRPSHVPPSRIASPPEWW